jgi:hypothetical protein
MKAPSDYRVRINGRLWNVRFRPARHMGEDWGRCWDKHRPGRHPLIEIRAALARRPSRLLEVIVHECLHAARPELDEATIDATAASIAAAIRKAGFTRGC